MTQRPTAFVGARLVDPASGWDGPGALLVQDGKIADVAQGRDLGALSADIEVIDAAGAMLAPGLVDLRVKTGEPGNEPKETLKSASLSAAATMTSRGTSPRRETGLPRPAIQLVPRR